MIRSYPSSSTDWIWFGQHSPEEIGQWIVNSSEKNTLWLQKAYTWLYLRLSQAQKKLLPRPLSESAMGPPSRFVPLPWSSKWKRAYRVSLRRFGKCIRVAERPG